MSVKTRNGCWLGSHDVQLPRQSPPLRPLSPSRCPGKSSTELHREAWRCHEGYWGRAGFAFSPETWQPARCWSYNCINLPVGENLPVGMKDWFISLNTIWRIQRAGKVWPMPSWGRWFRKRPLKAIPSIPSFGHPAKTHWVPTGYQDSCSQIWRFGRDQTWACPLREASTSQR